MSSTPTLSTQEAIERLRASLEACMRRSSGEAILLSGGLDTSIVATLACLVRPLHAYTVALHGASAPDVEFAKLMARRLGMHHKIHTFTMEEFVKSLGDMVRTLQVFDPMEIRNSAAVFIGLRQAREDGATVVLTGDGCDELFAGYSFLFNLDTKSLRTNLERLWQVMSFSSIPMAKSLGMEANLPFLDAEIRAIADHVDPSLLVVETQGTKWGKWIVRKAFEDLLPPEITWRIKTPIEYGCGTTTLPRVFDELIPNEEFEEKQLRIMERDRVTIRDKEHLVYYEEFRKSVGLRGRTGEGRTCPGCNFSVPKNSNFCKTCGAYPI